MFSSLEEAFERDIRAQVLAFLPCVPQERAALEKERASDLLIIYFNWLDRLIDAVPRTVHISDALQTNTLIHNGQYATAYDAILAKIERGEPLTPHLSRGIRFGYEEGRQKPKDLKRRRDLDLLLADWGIHHLHLSTALSEDGFVVRTGPLLLGVFHRDDAYLIDIIEHGDWSNQALMETVVRNWPSAGILYEMKGVLGLDRTVNATDRKRLREAGINVPLEIGGKVYVSPCGLSTAGTSTNAAMRASHVRRDVEAFCKQIKAEPFWLTGLLLRAGVVPPDQPDLRFLFLGDGYGVMERRTGAVLRLR